jgi:hypothetical protein
MALVRAAALKAMASEFERTSGHKLTQRDAANAFIKFLTEAVAVGEIKKTGMEPG